MDVSFNKVTAILHDKLHKESQMLSRKSCWETPFTQSTMKLSKEHIKVIIDKKKTVGGNFVSDKVASHWSLASKENLSVYYWKRHCYSYKLTDRVFLADAY